MRQTRISSVQNSGRDPQTLRTHGHTDSRTHRDDRSNTQIHSLMNLRKQSIDKWHCLIFCKKSIGDTHSILFPKSIAILHALLEKALAILAIAIHYCKINNTVDLSPELGQKIYLFPICIL
jgi:hypothetical protein